MDECESLLGHLEQQIVSPEATATKIATLVSELASSSVAAPRKLPQALLDRLGEIAAEHGGSVPLHGRLFAQWMHHAFPRECPYPHLSGTTNPQTPDEWLESTGAETTATNEEMLVHVDKAEPELASVANVTEQVVEEMPSLPWSPEEELLVVRPPQMQAAPSNTWLAGMRNALLFMSMALVAFGLVRNSFATRSAGGGVSAEKFLV